MGSYRQFSSSTSQSPVHDKEFRRDQELQTRLLFMCCKVIKRIIVLTTAKVH
jgi:hypothetical protein